MNGNSDAARDPHDRVESTKDQIGPWFKEELAESSEFALAVVDGRENNQGNRDSQTH